MNFIARGTAGILPRTGHSSGFFSLGSRAGFVINESIFMHSRRLQETENEDSQIGIDRFYLPDRIYRPDPVGIIGCLLLVVRTVAFLQEEISGPAWIRNEAL
jgi:hypothetical protein